MQDKSKQPFTVERGVLALAGTLVLASVIIGLTWTPWAYAVTLFVGANMLQAAFTGFCPAAMIFGKLGLKSGSAFN